MPLRFVILLFGVSRRPALRRGFEGELERLRHGKRQMVLVVRRAERARARRTLVKYECPHRHVESWMVIITLNSSITKISYFIFRLPPAMPESLLPFANHRASSGPSRGAIFRTALAGCRSQAGCDAGLIEAQPVFSGMANPVGCQSVGLARHVPATRPIPYHRRCQP